MSASLASRDDSYDATVTAITVTNQKQSQRPTQTKENKTIFINRVIWVVNQFGPFVDENRFRLLKTDPVLLCVCRRFALVPFKAQIAHGEMITTM